MSRLPSAFGSEPAFIPYLAVGDPDIPSSKQYVEALVEGGADCIELGLPFSEPIAEGPTIQKAVVRSLSGGITPDAYFEFVDDLDVDVPLVCMTYYNLIFRYGAESGTAAGEGDYAAPGPRPFVKRAAEVGIDGFVVPDLPAEEADDLREACDEFGLDLVFIVAPTTTDDRLETIREQVSGYVYVQARLGVTGAQADVSDQTAESLARIADWDVPKAVGFGISSGDHAARVVEAGADGIIVGSALVDIVADGVENDRPTAEVADALREKARELKEGALRSAKRSPETDGR
ncbi:tryptophan synthase subunit alpha [Halolamina salifodinae]|uniref:Tryptophan synthase alpha chain n=1 Tax=Halolamina salifodinae TaxID=1202767 RepID=A0A8T4H0Y8_9EURY|nr:tryptophan synthase subunit alpha [Halolamina salifodinae]MBP1988023.1 tryptophan synthase alpha chain [Halolamina salifodinae]